MTYLVQITFDSQTPHSLADWWADALGWEVEPSNETFIRDMIAQGYATDDDTMTHRGVLVWKAGAAIRHPAGAEGAPRILFQWVPEAKTVKNRVHLDLRGDGEEPTDAVARFAEAGATVIGDGQQGPHSWTVLADPEGNEFCV